MNKITTAVKQANSKRRAFATRRYPLFGRGVYSDASPPASVINSPFYWWFKFLQLNDEYAKAVAGKTSRVSRRVAKDFGDVRNTDFKSWWYAHVDLFAEPPSDYKMVVATTADELVAFGDSTAVNLVVPLTWTNVGLKRRFAEIIDKLVAKTPAGVRAHTASEAKYRLGRKWSTVGFQHAYDVYVARQAAQAEMAETGKKVAWADVAIRAGLPAAKRIQRGASALDTGEARRVLTILAVRHYRQAQAFIAASTSTAFPAAKSIK
ncbi:hypothetical protein MCERE10_03312 [Burkholderiaceae bacterium]